MVFWVQVKEVWDHTVKVDMPADATRQQIEEEVNRKIEAGACWEVTEYNHTLDPDYWTIRDDGGNYL
jgi:hypothetical protein